MSNYVETYKQWCTDPYFDADTKAELKKIEGGSGRDRGSFLQTVRIWYRWFKRRDRSRNQPYEYLYRTSGNTGTCKLHYFPEWTGKGCCDRT